MGTLSTFSEEHGARLTKTKLMEVTAPLAEARNESIGTELSIALSRSNSLLNEEIIPDMKRRLKHGRGWLSNYKQVADSR